MAKRETVWGFYKLRSILGSRVHVYRNRSSSSTTCLSHHEFPATTASMNSQLGLRLFSRTNYNKPWIRQIDTKMVKFRKGEIQKPLAATFPKQSIITNWLRWVMGSLLSFMIPFWTYNYWGKLRRIEGEAVAVMEEVEEVAEVIEKVAIKAEKVSAEAADKLPDHTKLKEIALLVERVSKLAAQDAHLTEEFIHKVDALKNDVGELEKLLHPVVDKINAKP